MTQRHTFFLYTLIYSFPLTFQAMCDVCADAGWLHCTLNIIALLQMVTQGHWQHDSQLLQLPRFKSKEVAFFQRHRLTTLPQVASLPKKKLHQLLSQVIAQKRQVERVEQVVQRLPLIDIHYKLVR